MNYFTKQSIELANQKKYLDQLFSVYPLSPDSIREIDANVWKDIEKNYNENNNIELFKALLKLDLFPIKDSYVSFFKLSSSAIERNPETVNRICGRIHELGIDKLYEKCTQPKETNRQMGPLFRNWLNSDVLGKLPVDEETFLKSKDFEILKGSDKQLKDFAVKHLGYTRDKGLDFVAKRKDKFIIGEAKFITDKGGHQNDQFLDAITTLDSETKENVVKVAILDGVLYIKSKKKMFTRITSESLNVMSVLLLRDFIYSL